MFRPATTNAFIHRLYPKLTWRTPTTQKKLYLTFDDGPTPNVTEWVLEQLAVYDAKATFFCIGQNVLAHPHIFKKIKAEGHSTGNHTFTHPNGWNTPFDNYIEDVQKCGEVFSSYLFRPPYGKITRKQSRAVLDNLELLHPKREQKEKRRTENREQRIEKKGEEAIHQTTKKAQNQKTKIIMWDVLSWDFDRAVSPEQCLNNVLPNVKKGSIIVFHDSEKAFANMRFALPKVLAHFSEKGYQFLGL